MKKLSLLLLSCLLIMIFSGCGQNEAIKKGGSTKVNEVKSSETAQQEQTQNAEEPHDDEMCAFCNMKVYASGADMGASTTQALTSDGKHLFFDDSGCLLNAPRQSSEQYEKQWVRDYNTKEWIEKDNAIIIKSDVATPMKYGYSFFATQESADQFLSEHKDQNAILTTWEEVDQVANERFQMKMKKTKEKNSSNNHSEMNNQDSDSHSNN